MCCFEKRDLFIWITHEWFRDKTLLCLRLTPDGRDYNDFFTVERVVGGGMATEVIFTVPFETVREISYRTASASSGERCALLFDLIVGEECLRDIPVDRHCFDLWTVRKLIKVFKKSKKAGAQIR